MPNKPISSTHLSVQKPSEAQIYTEGLLPHKESQAQKEKRFLAREPFHLSHGTLGQPQDFSQFGRRRVDMVWEG